MSALTIFQMFAKPVSSVSFPPASAQYSNLAQALMEDSDEEFLKELCSRPSKSTPNALTDAERDEWLHELLTCHQNPGAAAMSAPSGSSECQPAVPAIPCNPTKIAGVPVTYCLTQNQRTGKVLQHCCERIDSLLTCPTVFKIGITEDPMHRWSNRKYGYCLDRDFATMIVLAETQTIEGAAFLEAALIDKYGKRSGCRNIASGGEGVSVSRTGPCYVYVVFRRV